MWDGGAISITDSSYDAQSQVLSIDLVLQQTEESLIADSPLNNSVGSSVSIDFYATILEDWDTEITYGFQFIYIICFTRANHIVMSKKKANEIEKDWNKNVTQNLNFLVLFVFVLWNYYNFWIQNL